MRSAKGVVLGAGLGARLRPITDRWPKPLVPFAGTTPLELALWRLKELGLDEIGINTHYLPQEIAAAAAKNPFRQKIQLFHEPEILGTGGCYPPMAAWAADNDLVVLNGDVVSDMDLTALLDLHRKTKAVATMMLLPSVLPGARPVFHEAGCVVAIGDAPKALPPMPAGNFATAQILSPEFRALLPKGGSYDVISEGYQPALAQKHRIACLFHEGFWHDLGSPAQLARAHFDLLAQPHVAERLGVTACRLLRGLSPQAPYWDGRIEDGASVGANVVISAGASIGKDAVVRNALLLPGASLEAGAVVDSAIVLPGTRIPV